MNILTYNKSRQTSPIRKFLPDSSDVFLELPHTIKQSTKKRVAAACFSTDPQPSREKASANQMQDCDVNRNPTPFLSFLNFNFTARDIPGAVW